MRAIKKCQAFIGMSKFPTPDNRFSFWFGEGCFRAVFSVYIIDFQRFKIQHLFTLVNIDWRFLTTHNQTLVPLNI